MFRLENLSFTSPPCLHSDWFASSFAQAFGSPLVVLHFLLLRFSLPSSDSRGPTFISDFIVSSRFWAAHLVSSAITHCWKPLRLFGCVLPVRLSHTPKASFFHISFSFARPFLSSALRLVTLFDWTRWLRALFGRNPVRREPSLIDSLHQVSSPAIRSYPLVSKGEFLSCLAQKLSLFSLDKDSPSTLFDRGGEYHSINNKKKVAIPFQMVWAWKQPAIYR